MQSIFYTYTTKCVANTRYSKCTGRSLSVAHTHPRSLHVEQHVVRLFQHSPEDGQPLCSNSTVDHSVVTAEGDTHHIGHLEAAERGGDGAGWGCGVQGGVGMVQGGRAGCGGDGAGWGWGCGK